MSSKTESEDNLANSASLIPSSQLRLRPGDDDLLGLGCFGSVYRCFHSSLGQVAVKMFGLRGSRMSIDQAFVDIQNEIQIMTVMEKSSYVIDVYGFTEVRYGMLGLVMQYLPRGSLFDLVQESIIPCPLLLRIMCETATGLSHLHQARFDERVTHNDLKPENILLDADFHAKLCDFGGSNLAAYTNNRGPEKTSGGNSTVHTVFYAAPEFLNDGRSRRTRAMDVYSYAMLIYYTLTRDHPYGTSAGAYKAGNGIKPNFCLDEICKAADDEDRLVVEFLAEIMKRCWVTDPDSRPQITAVKNELKVKLDDVDEGLASLAVDKLKVDKPLHVQNKGFNLISLDEKCRRDLVPKLEPPFDVLGEVMPRSERNDKATISTYGGEAILTLGQEKRESVKATCSTSINPAGQLAAVKQELVIDIAHTSSILTRGDRVFIQTKSGIAVCRVEQAFT